MARYDFMTPKQDAEKIEISNYDTGKTVVTIAIGDDLGVSEAMNLADNICKDLNSYQQ